MAVLRSLTGKLDDHNTREPRRTRDHEEIVVMIDTTAGYVSTAGEVRRKYSKSLLLLVVKLLLLVLVTTARRVSANGNSFKPAAQTTTNADGTSTSLIPGPVTTEEKVQKKNDVKARSMLLMALPNEHLMTFNHYKDAKTLFTDIQTRFGGNEATKKTQKTLLKQISLPFEWNTHVVVWRNKPDLNTMSFDDLYNNFKIVKQEVKRTESSSSSSSSQNIDFVSSPCSTNEVNTAYGVSTTNNQVCLANTQLSRGQKVFSKKTGRKITINGSDTAGYDKSKVECFNCHKMGHFVTECRGPRNQDSRNRNQDSSRRTVNVEETSSKAMVAIDGAGLFLPPNLDLSYSGLEEFQQPDFEGYGPKTSKSVSEDVSNEVREYPDAPLVEELVSDDKLEKKTIFSTIAKIEFVRPKQQEKPVKYAEMYRLTAITIKGKGWYLGIILQG
ncbi:ribonuclease H-like domain-containing protein [Tanacetum coccineum]